MTFAYSKLPCGVIPDQHRVKTFETVTRKYVLLFHVLITLEVCYVLTCVIFPATGTGFFFWLLTLMTQVCKVRLHRSSVQILMLILE